jgi:hypothetical protein
MKIKEHTPKTIPPKPTVVQATLFGQQRHPAATTDKFRLGVETNTG